MKDVVAQTSGFTPRDLRSLIADAGANVIPKDVFLTDPGKTIEDNSLRHERMQSTPVEEIIQQPRKEDLSKALERSKRRNASALGAPKVTIIINDLLVINCLVCIPFLTQGTLMTI